MPTGDDALKILTSTPVVLTSVRRLSIALAVSALAGAGAAAQPRNAGAPAAEVSGEPERDFALWLGRIASDNVARLSGGTRGSYDSLGVLFDIDQRSQRLESRLDTNIEFRHYSDENIEDKPVGMIDGALHVGLIPDRLGWGFEETYGQILTDPFNASGPFNRESINVFTTGPELDLPLGASTVLSAAARHSTRRYDDTDTLDNDARLYEIGAYRQARETSRYGLRWTTNEIDYDAVGLPPYDIDRGSLHYERRFSSGGVSVDIGVNELTFLDSTTDEPLFNFEWSRDLAARSALRVIANREFSDTGANLRADLSQGPVGSDSRILPSSSPFEQKRLFSAYTVGGARTSLTIGLSKAEESYVTAADLDNENSMAQAAFRRNVTPRLSFGVDVYRVEREFQPIADEPLRKDIDETISAWVNRSIGRVFGLAVVLSHYERGGTIESFDENRYEIRLTYSPSNSATEALGAVGR